MKIYNQDKTVELLESECDLSKGYLKEQTDIIEHPKVEYQAEKGYYKTIKEYPNGGKDVEWIIEQPGIEAQEAWVEEDTYKIYIPYTEDELKQIELQEEEKTLKETLNNTDYQVIKAMEEYLAGIGILTNFRKQRESYRERIREIEKELN